MQGNTETGCKTASVGMDAGYVATEATLGEVSMDFSQVQLVGSWVGRVVLLPERQLGSKTMRENQDTGVNMDACTGTSQQPTIGLVPEGDESQVAADGDKDEDEDEDEDPLGALLGGSIGGILVVGLAAVGAYYLMCRSLPSSARRTIGPKVVSDPQVDSSTSPQMFSVMSNPIRSDHGGPVVPS